MLHQFSYLSEGDGRAPARGNGTGLRGRVDSPYRPGATQRLANATNFPKKTLRVKKHEYVTTPYEDENCSSCTSELDCRRADEFCNAQGCCVKGKCATDADCQSLSSLNHYYTVPGFDSFGYDLNPLHPQDNPKVLRSACDVNPACVGYTSYGMLKHGIQPAAAWTTEPAITGMTPWIMYLKKTAVDQKNPNILMAKGVKEFCAPQNSFHADGSYLNGLCRQCLVCSSNADCPESTVCDTVRECCVNNPCFTATPEKGKWVDGRYDREPQCDCPADKQYCCLDNPEDVHSAFCSAVPCTQVRKVLACSYLCEDSGGTYDAVMCKANQQCCNAPDAGPPVCCTGTGTGTPCSMSGGANQCAVAAAAPA